MENDEKIIPESTPSVENPVVDPTPSQDEDKQPGKKTAEARIDQLIAINKQLQNDLQEVKGKVDAIPVPTPPPEPVDPSVTPDVEKAVGFVKKVGKFVDQDYLESKLKSMEDRRVLDSEHSKYESTFNGQDGGPVYNRGEMEKYMNDTGIYNPKAAYEQKFKDELFDLRLKTLEKSRKTKAYVPNASSTAETRDNNLISREKIDEVMKHPTPENKAWYEQNRASILAMYRKGQL